MAFKHKFILLENDGSEYEVASCLDLSTANVLHDYFVKMYDKNNQGISVFYKYKQKKEIIAEYQK